MKGTMKKAVITLVAVAVLCIAAVGTAFAAWHASKSLDGNVITTGSSVTYGLENTVINGVGLLPGGTATQEIELDLKGGAKAELSVSAIKAYKTGGDETEILDGAAGIGTYFTITKFEVSDGSSGWTTASLTNITANGAYRITFTLSADTPDAFADCDIEYTLSLSPAVTD